MGFILLSRGGAAFGVGSNAKPCSLVSDVPCRFQDVGFVLSTGFGFLFQLSLVLLFGGDYSAILVVLGFWVGRLVPLFLLFVGKGRRVGGGVSIGSNVR